MTKKTRDDHIDPEDVLEKEEIEEAAEVQEEEVSPEDFEEKYKRALAETENVKRRFETERATIYKFAASSLLEELLPVIDNFYRATEHIPEEQKSEGWVTGVLYIQKNLLDVLEQHGVKEIEVKPGDEFDPAKHEALESRESEDLAENKIIEVKIKGYNVHDRLLRPAQVVVSK